MLLRTDVMMRRLVIACVAAIGLVACSADRNASETQAASATAPTVAHITVHKTPTCGCCTQWVEHVVAEGFSVTVHDHADLTPIRKRLGIPERLASCHSAEVDGYALEGHVPASDILRLLSERPDAIGLSVPGMPASAPGMDMEGVKQSYATLLFDADTATVFTRHDGDASD
ncbi:hypothetical protein GCM10007853_17710 [Algimonas ampicilliniresistens]|uniref:DUF411 domain-containing protein n=2 Tax=Algimonas ampicilliniresistens TaxID=1298735 RepID=A0ABQ5VA62_9PROT|nr:hypothetical protein GCM10007853_17710 [Algimonas ampicilliniresistens]